MSDSSRSGRGSNFAELLLLMFIYLKLTGQIDWSWWYVMSPLVLILGILIISMSFLGGITYFENRAKKRKTP